MSNITHILYGTQLEYSILSPKYCLSYKNVDLSILWVPGAVSLEGKAAEA
jgi:hypothetical protein